MVISSIETSDWFPVNGTFAFDKATVHALLSSQSPKALKVGISICKSPNVITYGTKYSRMDQVKFVEDSA